jgi:hypothetical protein
MGIVTKKGGNREMKRKEWRNLEGQHLNQGNGSRVGMVGEVVECNGNSHKEQNKTV